VCYNVTFTLLQLQMKHRRRKKRRKRKYTKPAYTKVDTKYHTPLCIVHFNNIQKHIVQLIETVPFLYIASCWLSNRAILDTILNSNCKVSILVTSSRINKKSIYQTLKPARHGCTVKTLGSDKTGGFLMHHKFAIGLNNLCEPIWTINGSYNWTNNAENNVENINIFHDASISTQFLKEFDRLWASGRRMC